MLSAIMDRFKGSKRIKATGTAAIKTTVSLLIGMLYLLLYTLPQDRDIRSFQAAVSGKERCLEFFRRNLLIHVQSIFKTARKASLGT